MNSGTLEATAMETRSQSLTDRALVSVVITAYNHARFLAEAIESVLAQTVQDFELIVVDDGSRDNTAEVVARYPRARYIHQRNQGLSAARNAGLKNAIARYVVFLDADDRLRPNALEAGLRCHAENPNCAFVSGRYRFIRESGEPMPTHQRNALNENHYQQFLRRNFIGMHATVMYDRAVFSRVGLYDTKLRAAEDYDMYLRISREHPVAIHEALVAEYRMHGTNMSKDLVLMVKATTAVLKRQRPFLRTDEQRTAVQQGIQHWRDHYTEKMLRNLRGRAALLKMLFRAPRLALSGTAAEFVMSKIKSKLKRRLKALVPSGLRRSLGGRINPPPVGRTNFGDLRRLEPISRHYGFDRGQPIDRYYIEGFLKQHAGEIRGRVLEIGDNQYTMAFGGQNVVKSDVLHVQKGNPKATFVGDISDGANLPSDAFDCIILTQTLHLIYEIRAAVATLHRILKPGGVLLMTVPGTISQIEAGTWASTWHWGFTELSIRKLVEERFAPEQIVIRVHGNVFASIAFLEGVAANELNAAELDHEDRLYPLLITVRAEKRAA
jgi:SAM-dependent methyltransferase